MARLHTCGFESQSLTPGVEITTLTGTASISTTVHRKGTAALRCNPAAATGYVEQQVDTASSVKRTFHRVYMRVDSLPTATTTVLAIGQSGFFPLHLRLTTGGTLQLRDSFNSVDLGTASPALQLATWYRVEVDAEDSGSSGITRAVTAYLDGTDFSGTTAIAGTSGYSRYRVGPQTATSCDLYVDDIAVNDTTGSAQTGLPGPGNVIHLRPSSAGDNAGFATTSGGTSNWQRVSETTPDDATTYNATSAAGTTTIDDFNLASSASAGIGAGDTVSLVAVGARIGSTAVTAASLVYRLKAQAAGLVTESASVSVALSGWASHRAAAPYVYQLVSYTNPQTGGVWTPALLDTAQIGYRANVSQATVRRVSTLWLLVEFVPEPGRLIEQLVDAFTSPVVDTVKWPDNYNENPSGQLPDQPDGRARVPCAPYFAAYASAPIYSLADSQIHVQVVPPAVGGGTGEVFAQLLVVSSIVGTQIVFEVDVSANLLMMALHVDYEDEGGASIPYNRADHAWLRLREVDGTLYWETSADGRVWTVRHSDTAPGWVADSDLAAQLLAYREDGTPDFAYFDNVNVAPTLPAGYSVEVDWNGDGFFDGPSDDVTTDVLQRGPVTFQYGRDQDRQLAPPAVGSLTMSLCNAERIYSPENPDSPIGDELSPAAPVRIETAFNDVMYPLFRGRVDDFDVHPDRGNRSIDISALDMLGVLQGTKISTELYQAQRTGTLIDVILDAIGWSGPRDLDLGATHVAWWWLEEADAYSAMTDLLASEGPPSIAYAAPDGTFIFRDRHHRLLRSASLTPQAVYVANRDPQCDHGGGGDTCPGYGECGFGEGGYGG